MKSLSRIPRRGITRPKGTTFFEALDINAKSPPVSRHHLGSLISPPESEWAASPLSASSTAPSGAVRPAGEPSARQLHRAPSHPQGLIMTSGKPSITRPILETPPAINPC